MEIEQLVGNAIMQALQKREHKPTSRMIGKYVLCRCVNSGVHAGVLVEKNGTECSLTESRRLWHWVCKKGDFLSGVAKYGLSDESKVGTAVNIDLLDVCEIIQCSTDAEQSIRLIEDHLGA